MTEKVFNDTSEEIIHQLENVLKSPDEVYWSDSDDTIVKRFFKHFKDGSLEATVYANGIEKAQVAQFKKYTNPDTERNGLLIYNKNNN
ncbi:hypothetical protein [Polaribacter sejongensis]|uniref:hypothetical protein n=1 Tax=Polaribacter sejongensis TaxID=985043 RepID=UPI0035A57F5F